MKTLHVTTRAGLTHFITPNGEASVMEVIRSHGLEDVFAICGGCCSCATCHVHVDPAFLDHLPGPSEEEEALLDSVSRDPVRSRLSCQLECSMMPDGLAVTIAPEP